MVEKVSTNSLGDELSFDFSFNTPYTPISVSTDDVIVGEPIDVADTFWKLHDLFHDILDKFGGEIGITITSPTGKSLRYIVRKV